MTIDTARIDELVAPHLSEPGPGCNVAVVCDGAVEWVGSYGLASLEHNVPVIRETVFYIASTSKQFVAASIVLLEAEGLLSLDDDIREYLPEMHAFDPPIAVHHLLHHTSGIRDKYSLAAVGALPEESYSTDRGSLELISAQRTLGFPTGSIMDYTNSGYFLLAQIVERVSRVSFPEFTQTRIFEPLGMDDTMFRADTNVVIPHRASGYTKTADGFRLAEYTLSSLGPGGVVAHVDDLARWVDGLTTGKLNPPDLDTRMQRTRPLADGSTNRYACGVMVDEWRGLPMIAHAGGVAGFSAELIRFPTEGLAVICLTNSPSVQAPVIARQVAELVLGDRLEPVPTATPPPPSPSEHPLDDWVGSYVAERDVMFARIVSSGDGHDLEVAGLRLPLVADGEHGANAGPLVLHRNDDGTLDARQGENRIGLFRPFPDDPAPSDDELCGTYRSEELDCTATVERSNDGLVFVRQRAEPAALEHRGGDVFTSTGTAMSTAIPMVVRLLRSDGSGVTGLSVSVARGPGNVFRRL